MQSDEPPLDTLAISDLEDQLDSLLRSHGQNDLWQLAADLARKNVKPEVLESLVRDPRRRDGTGCAGADCGVGRDCEPVASKLKAAPREFPTWCAPSRNTPTWTRRRCRTSTS